MENYETLACEFTYTVQMVSNIAGQSDTPIFEDDVRATSEEEAIAIMKNSLWESGFDNDDFSVLSAQKVIEWN